MEEQSKNIELQESGLVCDNPNCDWEDKTIAFSECHNWINEPCPKCGDNLLTQEDYNNAKTVHLAVDFMNKLSPEDIVELAELTKQINPEVFNQVGLDANEIDVQALYSAGKVSLTIDTHKEIRITDIKPDPEA